MKTQVSTEPLAQQVRRFAQAVAPDVKAIALPVTTVLALCDEIDSLVVEVAAVEEAADEPNIPGLIHTGLIRPFYPERGE